MTILHDLAIAVTGWLFLRQNCLLPLKQSPLRWGFTWIKGFSWRRIWTSHRGLSPDIMFDYLWRMENANDRSRSDRGLKAAFAKLHILLPAAKKDDLWATRVAEQFIEVHENLARVATRKLELLNGLWQADRGAVTGPEDKRGMHLEELIDGSMADDDKTKRVSALDRMADEEFVALLYLGYIRMVLVQIRNRIVNASVMYVLFLWALTSYPWMNRQAILIALCALLAAISGAALYVYGDMHRDDILSRTTETPSGKLDPAFFEKIIPTIGIPLLTLIASQFPQVSNFIFSWLEPSLR